MSTTISGTALNVATITSPTITGATITSASNAAPAFSAYQSTGQTAIAIATFTKIVFQTKEFDTNNNFDNTTNYRFTPTVAGYYQVNGGVYMAGFLLASIYKNGTEYKRGSQAAGSTSLASGYVSSIVYLNGSTDYIEIWCYQTSAGSQIPAANIYQTYFNAAMIRSA